jgi:general secretion pathway protein D
MHNRNIAQLCIASVLLAGCGTAPIQPSGQHLLQSPTPVTQANSIPQPVKNSVALPPPKPAGKLETYNVVVTNVPAQEVLFALARDAKINLDIQPGIEGNITVNAINQTLPQILTRIAKQIDMRYELDNGTLAVMPDTPYLRTYKIDYVNMSRDSDSTISNSTQVGSISSGTAGGGGGTATNNSSLTIKNSSKNHFWDTLTQNIKDILRETDKIFPEGSSEITVQQNLSKSGVATTKNNNRKKTDKNAPENLVGTTPIDNEEEGTTITRRSTFREAASVIANPENGVLTVRATGKQHEKVQEFIDQIMSSARRQVLIEATILEVHLSDQYQQGIDWSAIKNGSKGFTLTQRGTAGLPSAKTGSMFVLNYTNPLSALGNLSANISLLESFGTVKVLSSPKLSVMNNQTAILRVVDNLVYFTIRADTTTTQTTAVTTYTTTANTVPIGFTMSVTPQINDSDSVLLNLRPSISHLLGYVNDPNPDLANAKVVSKVPQTQTREMESILRIDNNQIAVMGGLMQDSVNNLSDNIPGISNLPLLGKLFQNRNDTTTKTELVIFLRPTVIKNAGIEGDYSNFSSNLPDENFFRAPTTP